MCCVNLCEKRGVIILRAARGRGTEGVAGAGVRGPRGSASIIRRRATSVRRARPTALRLNLDSRAFDLVSWALYFDTTRSIYAATMSACVVKSAWTSRRACASAGEPGRMRWRPPGCVWVTLMRARLWGERRRHGQLLQLRPGAQRQGQYIAALRRVSFHYLHSYEYGSRYAMKVVHLTVFLLRNRRCDACGANCDRTGRPFCLVNFYNQYNNNNVIKYETDVKNWRLCF